jgi:hypothetical protein
MLISFSGLDGSGKSTLISYIKTVLEENGYSVVILTMYYHISAYAWLRWIRNNFVIYAGVGDYENDNSVKEDRITGKKERNHRDPKIGVQDKFKWYQKIIYSIFRNAIVRRVVILIDLASLVSFRFYYGRIKNYIIITDRYLYDTLASGTRYSNISRRQSRNSF